MAPVFSATIETADSGQPPIGSVTTTAQVTLCHHSVYYHSAYFLYFLIPFGGMHRSIDVVIIGL